MDPGLTISEASRRADAAPVGVVLQRVAVGAIQPRRQGRLCETALLCWEPCYRPGDLFLAGSAQECPDASATEGPTLRLTGCGMLIASSGKTVNRTCVLLCGVSGGSCVRTFMRPRMAAAVAV